MNKIMEFLYGAGYICCIAVAFSVTLVIVDSIIGGR